ncbi:LacI family DNA-binding transcriptional regulator [Photobacterium sp. TY1-4]|uniref:LacI family DNA-binding transcriptional regulator n=1 Tax=Photobacterium sp. TY1-4 TaxID=2899122 RepID=UPI0021BE5DD1|nr:LacI family DNA-binding transcriptional regulator [Photobacterium sp. TY1-4]UXI03358.1 LacI family transcriptional regulator [Photobacterium sp. TY1-4]
MTSKPSLPTLDDVAALAGVSKAVASRALSGKNRPISADKKQRVLDAAETLGYVANPFAQSLSNKSTGLIAIVVNHIADISDLTLFDSLIQAIQALGKQTLFIRLRSQQDIAEIKRNPFVHRVDAALIFSDLIEPDEAPNLFYTNQVIMLNGRKDEQGLSVTINESLGIEQAIAEAQRKQIRQAILLCGRETSQVELQRVESYRQAMHQHGITLVQLGYCDYAYETALDYLQSHPIPQTDGLGVFCTSDSMAMAAMDFFRTTSPAMIERQAIFGFDNTPFSQLGSYRFSTIGYCKDEFVSAIVRLLTEDNLTTAPQKHRIVATRFYAR